MTLEQLMIAFILIEMLQVFFILVQVYATRRQLTLILEDPAYSGQILSNAAQGFIDNIVEEGKEGDVRRANLFGFMQVVGQNIMAGATGTTPGAPMKPTKLKGNAKILEPIVNNPSFQNMVVEFMKNKFFQGASKVADKKIDAALVEYVHK